MDEHLRVDGTCSYEAAFGHVLRTRPELFAEMQDPSGVVAAANFNPYHDQLGRFTTSDDAVAPHGREHHHHLPTFGVHLPSLGAAGLHRQPDDHQRPAQRPGADDAAGKKAAPIKEPRYRITPGAFAQDIDTSECSAAVLQEAVAQINKLRRVGDTPVPVGVDNTMRAINAYLNAVHQKTHNGESIEFGRYQAGQGADMGDTRAVLREKFNVHSQLIPIDQIEESLKQGPVLVSVAEKNNHERGHAELIMGTNGPQSYHVYNPLDPYKQMETINAAQIQRAEFQSKLIPVVYALRPLTQEEAKQQ